MEKKNIIFFKLFKWNLKTTKLKKIKKSKQKNIKIKEMNTFKNSFIQMQQKNMKKP